MYLLFFFHSVSSSVISFQSTDWTSGTYGSAEMVWPQPVAELTIVLSSARMVILPSTPNGFSTDEPLIASASFLGSVLFVFFKAWMTNCAPVAFSHDQFCGY